MRRSPLKLKDYIAQLPPMPPSRLEVKSQQAHILVQGIAGLHASLAVNHLAIVVSMVHSLLAVSTKLKAF